MPTPIRTTPEELAAATADYPVPLIDRQGFRCIDIVAANELAARIAREIVMLTGCDPRFAGRGAGGFTNMRSAPDFGLSDGSPDGSSGLYYLNQWLAAKVVAYRAAQDRAVAA